VRACAAQKKGRRVQIGHAPDWRADCGVGPAPGDDALSETDLDVRCETFLNESFDLKIDFEISDALQPLVKDGLVVEEQVRARAALGFWMHASRVPVP
jgi:hypothetical protein